MTLADIGMLALKSAIVAGLGLILARVVARRAADRVVMLRSAVVLTVALPLLTVLMPVLSLALLPAAPVAAVQPLPLWAGRIEPVDGYAVSGVIDWPGAETWVALAWLAVTAALAFRLALGLVTLMRWSREGRAPRPKAWSAALDSLAGKRRPDLIVSDRAAGPLSWGLPPGAILIDKASESRPETAPAVIAHELAHLKRGDWAFLMLSRLMLAMFWFNPLCWRLHAELAARSEEAADAEAVRTVDRADYARTLVNLAVEPGSTPYLATGMAASPSELKQRIKTLMTPNAPRRPMTLALSLVVLAAVATPLAALEISRRDAAEPPAAPDAPTAPLAPIAPVALLAQPDLPAPPAPPAPPEPPAPLVPIDGDRVIYIGRDDSPEGRAARDAAREAASAAREAGRAAREEARAHAEEVRALAAEHRRDADAIRVHALAAAEHARGAAAQAHVEVRAAMAQARVEMARGADEMRRGAEDMRREARRLQDPAHRAEVIAENRERGNEVTDQELRELSPRLMRQADELDRQADRLARQASEA